MNTHITKTTCLGNTFEVEIEPILFTEEVVGFRIVSYRKVEGECVGQRQIKGFEKPQQELFDDENPLLELRT